MLRRLRSASSARSFSIFSGKCLLAHHTRPITANTTNTVIKPNQNGSVSIRSDKGLYGICIIRFSHRVPSHHAWHLREWIYKLTKIYYFLKILPAEKTPWLLKTFTSAFTRIITTWFPSLITD